MTCWEHCGGEVYFLFFFLLPPLPTGPGRVPHMSAHSHGLRGWCSSCSFFQWRKCSRKRGLAVQWLHPLAPLLQHLQSSLPSLRRCAAAGCGCEQAGPCFVRQRQSVVWLFKAQIVRQRRTPLGLDISLALPKFLPLLWHPAIFLCFRGPAAKLRKMLLFSHVLSVSQAAALRGGVLYCTLHRQHKELFCWWEPLDAAAVQSSKYQTEQEM